MSWVDHVYLVPLYDIETPVNDYKYGIFLNFRVPDNHMSGEIYQDQMKITDWLNTHIPSHLFVKQSAKRLFFDLPNKTWLVNEGSSLHDRQIIFERNSFLLKFETQEQLTWFLLVWKEHLGKVKCI